MHGMDSGTYAYGLWTVVLFNVAIVMFFVLSFIKPHKRVEWRSMGAFTGFIVALFTEMYGIPLTTYLLTSWLGKSYPLANPFSHAHGHLVLVALGLADSAVAMTILHLASNGVILWGFYLIYQGWKLIHEGTEDKLVTEGIYSKVRHPQYDGIFLITIGFLVQWPSLTTLIMWPILTFAYYRLALSEERILHEKFGKAFEEYKARVPGFIPTLSHDRSVHHNKVSHAH